MTILAISGPIGTDFKTITQQCSSLLKSNTLIIDGSAHSSNDSLLALIENTPSDVIIFGPDIFLDEQLRKKFDIKVFLELDEDSSLMHHLKSKAKNLNLVEELEYYEVIIKPLNEQIRSSAKFADLRRQQTSSNDALIDLLINKEEKTLQKVSGKTLPKAMFWSPIDSHPKNKTTEGPQPTTQTI